MSDEKPGKFYTPQLQQLAEVLLKQRDRNKEELKDYLKLGLSRLKMALEAALVRAVLLASLLRAARRAVLEKRW